MVSMLWLPLAIILPFHSYSQSTARHDALERPIDRRTLVTRFNPTRRDTINATTPMQVGNGNFAFGSDITSLQTFLPFATMAAWGWKNDSLPEGRTQAEVDGYQGVKWDNHGRLVQYDFGGPPDIEAWLRGSPNRVNLGRVGLRFWSKENAVLNVTEGDLQGAKQTLDLWTGTLASNFKFQEEEVRVRVVSDFETDAIALEIQSELVRDGRLGLFVDFPWCEGKEKFSAPFVGLWHVPEKHTTNITLTSSSARIAHRMEDSLFYTDISGDKFSVVRHSLTNHLYDIRPLEGGRRPPTFSLSVSFSSGSSAPGSKPPSSPSRIFAASKEGWERFWTGSGFVDLLTGSTDPRADELQRRIVLSRYLMRVNEAGDTPPQEVRSTPNLAVRSKSTFAND